MKKISTKSSGNVFEDIGVKNPSTELIRAKLSVEIFKILKSAELTQTKAAEILGVKQPDLSRLKRGEFQHFSLERLFGFLNKLNRKITIKVSKRRSGDYLQKIA